jgi:murein L,D-transpeptidase YafK
MLGRLHIVGLAILGKTLRSIFLLCIGLVVAGMLAGCGGLRPASNAKANQPLKQETISKLASMGSSPGAGMMIRIFKESSELEVWKQTSGGYKLFKTYAICAWSGDLGPKVKEGDRQSPEGFYTITPGLMNPNSSYYLAFNTGFPNKFDRAYGRTGSDLMVHGDCSSRGCYSMTDESIAEIYALARETFKGGNPSFQLQIYPFRMTADNLAKHASNPNMSFWKDIKEGYDRFEIAKAPVNWDVCNKEYVFDVPGGTVLDPLAACPVSVAQNVPQSVKDKAAADEAAMTAKVAALAGQAAKAAAEAKKVADAQAAAKARGEAIGSFIGGLFGGEQVQGTVDPSIIPPVPLPRIHRSA